MKPQDPLANLSRATMNAMRANARLRAATAATSSAMAATRRRPSPPRRSPPKRRNSPAKKNKSPSPKRRNSPRRGGTVVAAQALAPQSFSGAIAHRVLMNNKGKVIGIEYFMPNVPVNKGRGPYAFWNPVR
jgi:hypothetical protein